MTASFTFCEHVQVSRFVKAFWQNTGTPTYQSEIILPKGVVELIFSFDDIVLYRNSQEQYLSTPRCFVNGINDKAIELRIPQRQSFFGIELHPAAVKKLLRIPSGEFLNAFTYLELINKEFVGLWHQLS